MFTYELIPISYIFYTFYISVPTKEIKSNLRDLICILIYSKKFTLYLFFNIFCNILLNSKLFRFNEYIFVLLYLSN